jgi:hypothetical protein
LEVIAVATPTTPAFRYDRNWIAHGATEKLEASNLLYQT